MSAIVPDEESTWAHSAVPMDTAADVPITVSKNLRLSGLKHLTFYFTDADDNELFLTPPGAVACAWQANAVTNLTTVSIGSTGILFDSAANSVGWLHVLCRGSLKTGSTTIDAPVPQCTVGDWQYNGKR